MPYADTRHVLSVSGRDRVDFLQGLVTNDVTRAADGLVWAALLTPQGKYLADFFILDQGDRFLVDVAADLAPALVQRLSMYKLRADVTIADAGLHASRGTGPAPAGAHADPRSESMGWRAYLPQALPDDGTDWDALRVAEIIPETGVELIPNDTYILEAGFDRLQGVDFRKGCYVGQEVTARMHHKTSLRKGLTRVKIAGQAPVGTQIFSDGEEVGTLLTQAGDHAIAHLRFDRAGPDMTAGDARVHWDGT